MSINGTSIAIARVARALPEARLDHGLSQRELARLSGVSATTIRKLEAGRPIDPALLVQVGLTIVLLDAYRPPSFDVDLGSLLWEARREAVAA